MKSLIHRAGAVLFGCLALGSAAAGPTRPTVVTDRGPVAGVQREDGVQAFLGIPYAEADRWRPPRDVATWTDPRDASRPGPACVQDNSRFDATAGVGMDEHCHSLNVFTAPPEAGEKRPVMVWIHGGSFRWGTGADPGYDGRAFVEAGMMVVTFNYRLGRLGRFAHPALSRDQAGEPLGNYALMDQLAALDWVRRNAAAFGGDPQRVTIFGCSAGGVSVTSLMASPAAAGLFQRAIAQSGGIVEVGNQRLATDLPWAPSLESDGRQMAARLGIADDAEAAAHLRALPAAAIVAYDAAEIGSSMNPVVDGRLLPDDIGVVFERGQQQPVPFMIGSADWEDSLLGRASIPPRAILAPVLGDLDAFRAAYDGADDEALAHGWFRDGAFIAPSRLLADRMARVGQPGYVYLFSYVADGQRGRVPGAAHCSETPFVFGNFIERSFRGVDFRYSDADRAFGEKVSAAWRSFARDGKPALPGTPAWPAFAFGDADVMMRLDAPPALEQRYRPAIMDYYRRRTEGLLARQKD